MKQPSDSGFIGSWAERMFPRVCDVSSDFLAVPCETERFSLIYAHARKNIGPAGVTVVLIRNELLSDAPPNHPNFLYYRSHIEAHSNLNATPVFAIQAVLPVTRWLMNEIGGVTRMAKRSQTKAQLRYSLFVRNDGFYRGKAEPRDHAMMNESFNLAGKTIPCRGTCCGILGSSW
jgi:phosphoserine aminotransferase